MTIEEQLSLMLSAVADIRGLAICAVVLLLAITIAVWWRRPGGRSGDDDR